MRRIVYSLMFMFASLGNTSAQAQEVLPLSLKDCIQYALGHLDTIRNSRLAVELQRARNAQITSAALPQINGKADFSRYLNSPVTFFPAEFGAFIDTTTPVVPGTFIPVSLVPKYSSSATVSGSQILFDGSVLVALQARNTIIKLIQQSAKLTEENIKYEIQRSYYALAIAEKQFNVLKNSLAITRKAVQEVQTTYETGLAEKIDADRANVQLSNLMTDSLRTGSLITLSEQMLKYQIGMDLYQPIMLTDTSLDESFTGLVQLADETLNYDSRTEYQLLNTQLKLNEFDLKRYKYAALPTLSAFANGGYNYSSNDFADMFRYRKNYVFSSMVGLTLNVPIFNGFLRQNQIKEARLNIERTENNRSFLKRSIDFQAAQARTTLKNAVLTIQSQQRNLQLANSVLDLATRKYREGVGSSLELTQAQREQLQAQSNYFSTLLDVINAQADLQRALGKFTND
jgi:outer membrane protein